MPVVIYDWAGRARQGWHLIVLGFISGDGPVMVTIVNRKRRRTRLNQEASKGLNR